ncbi:MAG: methyltransferase domain-containing protein [Planctomycetota bacterium]
MQVRYAASSDAWSGFRQRVKACAAQIPGGRVCDLGGGANPTLPLKFIDKFDLKYLVADVAESELDKLPIGYERRRLDIQQLPTAFEGSFDLVVSRMVAEHVSDARAFHSNIFRMLSPGGTAIHFFPTMYSLPFVLNRILPHRLSERLLHQLQPGRDAAGTHGKFPAFYRWCHGPHRRQQRRLESVGFRVEEYVGYFGHSGCLTLGDGYWDRFPLLTKFHETFGAFLLRHPLSVLTSYACVVLKKRPPSPVRWRSLCRPKKLAPIQGHRKLRLIPRASHRPGRKTHHYHS